MLCFSPFFTVSDNNKLVGFPCGKCPVCLQKRANEWALRISLESRMYQDLAFVTLTYSPEKLYSNELIPSHLSSFVKRLRTYAERAGYKGKIRFYGVGEYGEKRGRPHFHLVLFNFPQYLWHVVKDAWQGSIVDIQRPRTADAVASYVAGYVVKKLYTNAKIVQRQSLGIGKHFIDRINHFTQTIVMNGKTRYIGRYLRNRLAKRLGILEHVKAAGMQALEDSFVKLQSSLTPASHIPFVDREMRESIKELWQQLNRGMIDHVNALHKLKFLKE